MSANKKIIIAIMSGVLLLAASAAATGYSLWKQVTEKGGLKVILEQALSDDTAEISSSIESTDLGFSFSSAPFRLTATNIKLVARDTSLVLPSSEFGFSFYNILTGNLVPSDMRMSGLEIEIAHGQEGWHAGPSMALITSLMKGNAENAVNSQALSSIRNIYIGNAEVKIHRAPQAIDDGRPDTIVLSPIGISMRYQRNQINGNININNADGGAVEVGFTGNSNGSEVEFSAALNTINMDDIYPYLGLNIPEIKNLGQLDGRVNLLVRNRKIASLSGDLVSTDGKTELPAFGQINFSNAAILFAYDAIQDLLSISNFDMQTVTADDVPSGRINLTGQIRKPLSNDPLVIAKLRGSDLGFERLMRIWPDGESNDIRQKIDETFNGGKVVSLGVDAVGEWHRDRGLFEVSTFDLVSELRAIELDTSFASIERLQGRLGARFELSIGSNGRIEHASADLLLRDASLKPVASDDTVDLEGIEFRTVLDGNVLTINRGAIDARQLGQMAMIAQIELEPNWRPHRLDLSIKAEQIDKVFLLDLWPENIRTRTRQWADERIHGGQINGLSMNAGFDLAEDRDDDSPAVIYLDGKARLVNAGVTYIEDMPKVTDVNANLNFEGSFLRADFETGLLKGIDLAGSRVIIRKNQAGPMADVAILANGDFGGALEMINHPKLDLLKNTGLKDAKGEGEVEATMSLKWIIPQDNQTIDDVGGIDLNLSANVIDAVINNLPEDVSVTETNLDLMASDGRLNIAGRGNIDGAPLVMSMISSRNNALDIMVKLEDSEKLSAILMDKTGLELFGTTGGTVHVHRKAEQEHITINADVDFTKAGINLDRFGLTKLPSEPAKMTAQFKVNNGKFENISNLEFTSEVLSINGDVSFDESGQFLGAYFDHVSWPGNDISQITIEFDQDNVMNISADAHVIDLTPLRREESPGEGMRLEIDLTANRIVLDEKVSLSGNVALSTEENGIGGATFLGTLFLNGEEFMREGTMTALFGGGQDLMEGRGLIGGAEASISISPAEDNGSLMVLRSNNAGQILKTLNVLDVIRGGKLYMVTNFRPEEDGGGSMTNFELEDFRIIEAPTAVRMLSVLSLSGLYSLIEGDGTHFNLGYAKIELKDDMQIVHDARATGDALAVDLVGVINAETRELEVSGALLPVYGITKLIGKVPLISEILTGIDNSGLLVTQFTIKGTVDEPETEVNLSSIVPGVFRDVFSPDWIGRERKRLIGGEEAQDNATSLTLPEKPVSSVQPQKVE